MLPSLFTPIRAADYEAEQTAQAAQRLAGERRRLLALVAAVAFLLFALATIAERYHWLPEPLPAAGGLVVAGGRGAPTP